jgi:hypothetical protein
MSRPSKLTPETTAKSVQAIELGATFGHACRYAGIGYPTLRNWIIAADRSSGTTSANGTSEGRL